MISLTLIRISFVVICGWIGYLLGGENAAIFIVLGLILGGIIVFFEAGRKISNVDPTPT